MLSVNIVLIKFNEVHQSIFPYQKLHLLYSTYTQGLCHVRFVCMFQVFP